MHSKATIRPAWRTLLCALHRVSKWSPAAIDARTADKSLLPQQKDCHVHQIRKELQAFSSDLQEMSLQNLARDPIINRQSSNNRRAQAPD